MWGNSNNGGAAPQIANSFGTNTATASIIQGGQFGALNADPLFVTPLTASPTPSTAGNFQLGNASPAIDAGANANVPADIFDVNGNGNTTEDAPDRAGNPRRYDDTGVTDTGTGTPPIVDLGAFEKQTNSAPLFPMDVDFCNLQFPTSFTAAAGSTSPIIYGRIYEDDNGVLTSNPGAHPSIVAQLGHGPLGSDPRGGNPAWQWLPATYNTQVGNDDEYQGTFIVPFASSNTQRSYTYRFSVDSGANYTYCDSDGNGTNGGLSFNTASLGTLTINPGAQPSISINDVSLNEGNSGTTVFAFTISLNGPSLNAVSFDIATADNTATVANGDYVANSASGVVIPAGQTSASFNVLVNGDTTFEPNETF
ncbi:MAG: Calx-beta domain-containing protein, partial [Gammaproteobacteria bacterium]|nr:Calx-beta domain-containing protein [Gammaproteobacteria bacterium]